MVFGTFNCYQSISTHFDLTILWKRSWLPLEILKLIKDTLLLDLFGLMVVILQIGKNWCRFPSRTMLMSFRSSSPKETSSPLWRKMIRTFQSQDQNLLLKKLKIGKKIIEHLTFYFVLWILTSLIVFLLVIQPNKYETHWRLPMKGLIKFENPKSASMAINMISSRCYL